MLDLGSRSTNLEEKAHGFALLTAFHGRNENNKKKGKVTRLSDGTFKHEES